MSKYNAIIRKNLLYLLRGIKLKSRLLESRIFLRSLLQAYLFKLIVFGPKPFNSTKPAKF